MKCFFDFFHVLCQLELVIYITFFQFQSRNQGKLGAVQILKWGQNGKENHVQYLPTFNSLNSLTMGHCPKGNMDEIQVLEDRNRSSNISKRSRANLNLVDSPCYEAASRNGSGAEIVEIPPLPQSSYSKKEVEVIKIVQSPQPRRKVDNDVLVIKEHVSPSKEGRGHRETPFARKPFKVLP